MITNEKMIQMANSDHLKVLMTGVDKWTRWRREERNLGVEPDLRGIQLPEEHWLEAADFRWTNLSGAKLSKTILPKANLHKANLFGANLSGAFAPNSTLIRQI
jgi:uncharacterized protein YjbI with pentapeptide repeats